MQGPVGRVGELLEGVHLCADAAVGHLVVSARLDDVVDFLVVVGAAVRSVNFLVFNLIRPGYWVYLHLLDRPHFGLLAGTAGEHLSGPDADLDAGRGAGSVSPLCRGVLGPLPLLVCAPQIPLELNGRVGE